MEGISPFRSGRPLLSEVTADKLNRILSEIKRNRPVVAAPLSARITGDGTHISIKVPNGGGSAPATVQPWDLIARVDPDADPEDENPPYLVTVRPGTINGILPTNWDNEFTCANTGIYYAKAVIATDGLAITGVTISVNTSQPAAQNPQPFAIEGSIDYLFGLFAEGQVYRVVSGGHINLAPEIWLTKDKSSPAAAGALPYEIFYRLQ